MANREQESTGTPRTTVLVDLSLELGGPLPSAADALSTSDPPLAGVEGQQAVKQALGLNHDLLGQSIITTQLHGLEHYHLKIDNMPLHWFVGKAICLDLRHVPDLGDIDVADLENAEKKSGVRIDGHIVLICTGFHSRHWPRREIFTRNPGMTAEATHWLADRGSRAHGVEGPSTDKAEAGTLPSHRVCRERELFHYEWLVNLEPLLGKGEFIFTGYPLKWRGAPVLPVRAVAELPAPSKLLWLYTIGRKTGSVRAVELSYTEDGPDLVIVGSHQGSDTPPAWLLNLQANPHAEVQVGLERWPVVAHIANKQDRLRLWRKVNKEMWDYESYQKKTNREIPILILEKSTQVSNESS